MEKAYMIHANVRSRRQDGYYHNILLPTFFLNATNSSLTEQGAKDLARKIINPFDNLDISIVALEVINP